MEVKHQNIIDMFINSVKNICSFYDTLVVVTEKNTTIKMEYFFARTKVYLSRVYSLFLMK